MDYKNCLENSSQEVDILNWKDGGPSKIILNMAGE